MNYIKLSAICACLLCATFLSAQNDNQSVKKSEIKINGLYLILGGFEIDYEHILNEESSIGLSVAAFFDDDTIYNWGVTPHYRLFFGKERAQGFFVEGHASVFSWEPYVYNNQGTGGKETHTSAGVGLAVGGKFKTGRDVVVEVFGGVGRMFKTIDYDSVYPRFGINIGKRF